MLNLDVWLHQQLREQLWKGPAAVSAYLSVATQLIGVTLSGDVVNLATRLKRLTNHQSLITFHSLLPPLSHSSALGDPTSFGE